MPNSTALAPYQVVLHPTGTCFNAQPQQTLLQAGLEAGIDMESSCRNGTCRTCMCLMRQGRVHYQLEWPGLSAEEKAAGYILPCVAYARSDIILEETLWV